MSIKKGFFILVACSFISLQAQKTISAQLLDSTKLTPIPFASIQYNKLSGVISNENGMFTITINQETTELDTLTISCLGYNEYKLSIPSIKDSVLLMSPKIIDLEEVVITSKQYTLEEILERIKTNLKSNYETDFTKRTLFYRQSYYNDIDRGDIKLTESTIPDINQSLIDSVLNAIPKSTDNHTEILGEMYGKLDLGSAQKMEIFKASELYDKANELSLENYEKRFNTIFKKYVKRDSYFKIKSGIFGTKEEIDSSFFGDEPPKKTKEEEQTEAFIAEQKEREAKRKDNFLKYRKSQIQATANNHFFKEDPQLNFIEKSRRYEFNLLDYEFLNGELVYKISFEPKRSEDFKGIMYVNTEDFAIIRVDYKNVKPLRKFSLLGLSFKQYLQEGTMIFEKNDNDKYSLKYMDISTGQQVGIKRPLKIIEKNKNVKGRRKQNEVAADIHFVVRNVEKRQLVIFENSLISELEYTNFKEKPNVLPTYLKAYDPEFWQGYNIIEPNQAIKSFKVLESDNP